MCKKKKDKKQRQQQTRNKQQWCSNHFKTYIFLILSKIKKMFKPKKNFSGLV